MEVEVAGRKYDVSISDKGMFYDTATKLHFAKTLEGLKRKIRVAITSASPAISVRQRGTLRCGVVNGRRGGSGWQRKDFRVRWEDGTTSHLSYSLLKDINAEQMAEYTALQKAWEAKKAALDKANIELEAFNTRHDATQQLNEAFPEV